MMQGVHSPAQLLYCTVVPSCSLYRFQTSRRIVGVFMVPGLVSLVSSGVQWRAVLCDGRSDGRPRGTHSSMKASWKGNFLWVLRDHTQISVLVGKTEFWWQSHTRLRQEPTKSSEYSSICLGLFREPSWSLKKNTKASHRPLFSLQVWSTLWSCLYIQWWGLWEPCFKMLTVVSEYFLSL